MNPRAVAADILHSVIQDHLSLTLAFDHAHVNDHAQASLIKELCFGVCRWYFRLDQIAQAFLSKPLKQKDQDIYCLLLVGLYQLIYARAPDYAVVDETVSAVSKQKSWAKSLINGVLRQYTRQATQYPADPLSHPKWFIDRIRSEWPEQWEAILQANNEHPPFTLRVNVQKISREEYLQKCVGFGAVQIGTVSASAITLTTPIRISELPGFQDGEVSVQDEAAQKVAELLDLKPGLRVLDACAAPGGKTCHILEIEPHLSELIALESDAKRATKIHENLTRLHLKATVKVADATELTAWWDGVPYDRILLDAPCTATGVIRRHPDIKLLRQPGDIEKAAILQNRILEALWSTLQEGGILLYATCSIFREENSSLLERFLQKTPSAEVLPMTIPGGIPQSVGVQILPGTFGMDGFYFAKLQKK